MPSQLHEALLLLFRNRPLLAPELLRDTLHVELAQLASDERKRFVWPVYVTSLRARLEVPVCLLVITADDHTARWASRPIELGGGSRFLPLVLGPAGVPEITRYEDAQRDPELAVLSAMAHGSSGDTAKAAQIALAAQLASLGLDEDRCRLYVDLVMASLSDAVRRELREMKPAKYEYQSDFAKQYIAVGRAEIVIRLLTRRFGELPEDALARISTATKAELESIAERLLTATSLADALGAPERR